MNTHPLIFDIETVADLTPETHDDIAALAEQREMTPEHYGALCPPLARVVCVAWHDVAAARLGAFFDATLHRAATPPSLTIDETTPGEGAASCALTACVGEAALLSAFGALVEQYLGAGHGPLVTYNGRGFDLPVLVHRSFKHAVTSGRELLLKAVRENRYRPLVHVDLMDTVTFFGASNRWPMAAYAIGYGARSPKQAMDGSQVTTAVKEGRILDVVRYCATDVLATTHIYQTVAAQG